MIFMNLFRKQKEKLAYNIYNSKNTGVFCLLLQRGVAH